MAATINELHAISLLVEQMDRDLAEANQRILELERRETELEQELQELKATID
jgi:chromosome segregation ATPase